MIGAFAPDRTDYPFYISVLPRRPRRSWVISNPKAVQPLFEYGAITGIAISDDMSWGLIPREGFCDLLGDPFGRRMQRRIGPDQFTAFEVKNRNTVQQLEANRGHNEDINRRHVQDQAFEFLINLRSPSETPDFKRQKKQKLL